MNKIMNKYFSVLNIWLNFVIGVGWFSYSKLLFEVSHAPFTHNQILQKLNNILLRIIFSQWFFFYKTRGEKYWKSLVLMNNSSSQKHRIWLGTS